MLNTEPPRAQGNIEMVTARLREARADANRESITIEWRGRSKTIDVIDMPVQTLYYNPDTHRIRAQRELDPAREQELEASPWSERSQEYLHELLRGDPSDPTREDAEFRALRDDLQEHGQNDPGIITPSGILVNGNTRRAALRELGQPNIRVGVLPSDWGHADISAVELALQLRKEYRRDYSFINFLLAIDEQVSLGRSPTDIVRDFRIKQVTFQQARWLLAFIRDAIARSRAEGSTAAMRYVDFERDQEKLKELYRRYTALEARDPDAAQIMRETRLAALVLGFSKTDLRLIEPDFGTKYVDGWAPAGGADSEGRGVSIPGLAVTVPDTSSEVKRVVAATTAVLQARAAVVSGASDADTAAATLQATKQTFEDGLDLAGRDVRLRKRQLAAPERLSDAADMVGAAVDELVSSRATAALDEDAFDDALVAMRAALVRLAQHAARSISDPGPGLRWLNAATAPTDE